MESTAQQKSTLRAEILARRQRMGDAARAAASRQICDSIRALPQYQQARRIAAFAPMAEEVDIWPLLDESISDGKIVALPRVADKNRRRLDFHEYHSRDALREGYMKILEPLCKEKNFSIQSFDFIFVPAVAIDKQKKRLGYGGGFYDTVLANCQIAFSCAPVFLCQRVSTLPCEAHDLSVCLAISEKEKEN